MKAPLPESSGLPTSGRDRHLDPGLYISITFLLFASLYVYMPTLPIYVQSKVESLTWVGVVLAQYGLWQAVIRIPLGVTVDWVGRRKPFIMGGIVLSGLGAVILAIAQGTGSLIAGRALTGLAIGALVPLVVAFSALLPPEQTIKATSALTVAASVGQLAAVSVTGFLNGLGGYDLAYFVAAVCAGVAVLLTSRVREQPFPPSRPSRACLSQLLIRPDVLIPALLAVVREIATWGVSRGFLPILADQMGASDPTQSMLMSFQIGSVVLGGALATALVNRVGPRRLVYASFLLMSAGIGLAALSTSLLQLFGAQLSLGLSHGISLPILMGMSIDNVGDSKRTTAMGLHQSLYGIGVFIGPLISGLLADAIGLKPMFGVLAFGTLAGSTLLIGLLARAQPVGTQREPG